MSEDNHFGVWRQPFWCFFFFFYQWRHKDFLGLKIKWKRFIPSRSSIVFSSLATDLSANSARVSAWREDSQASAVIHEEVGSVANNQHFLSGGRWTCKSTGQMSCFNLPPWVCLWEPWSPPRICLPFASTVFAQNEVNIFKMEWLKRFHSFKKVNFCLYSKHLSLPSLPGPPETSGCSAPFSAPPQAQNICYRITCLISIMNNVWAKES